MAIHTLAFGANLANGALSQLNAIADQQFGRNNNAFTIPRQHYIHWMYASGLNLLQARINNGSLIQKGFPAIFPINHALLPASNPNIMDLRDYPIGLRAVENFRVDANNSGAGAEHEYVVCGISEDAQLNQNINVSDLRWLRFTASPTHVAFGWSASVDITFDDTLEGGVYSVYGMSLQETTVIAGRLIFNNQAYCPGAIGNADIAGRPPAMFMGGLGLWGKFDQYTPPQLQTLGDTAGAANVVGYLLCGK